MRVSFFIRYSLFAIRYLVFIIPLAGCAPAATVHIVPLNVKKINVNRPLLVTFSPNECYYWVNDRHELCVAMTGKLRGALAAFAAGRSSAPSHEAAQSEPGSSQAGAQSEPDSSHVGPISRHQFDLSLVLEGLPAGSSRAYRASFRTARARTRDGAAHTRFASFDGVVSVWNFGERKMNGRFRFKAVQQSYNVLLGWGKDTQVLCLGEFTATHDRKQGQAVFTRTEEGALERPPPTNLPIPVEGPPPIHAPESATN